MPLKFILRGALLVMTGLLAACGGNAPTTTDQTALQTQPTPVQPLSASALPTDTAGQAIVARVNNESISLAAFERELTRQQTMLNAASVDALRQDVLSQMIETTLLMQGATGLNLVVPDEMVQADIQAQVEQAGGQDAWTSWLSSNLYTAEEFPEVLRSVLTSNAVRDSLTADLEGSVRQANARHILVRTEQEANDALARLSAGEDFAALAASISIDETTRQNGGDLGWFTAEELFVPELAQAVFSLQVGQIAGPIGTELGYHVVQVMEFAEREVEPERRVYIAQSRFENWLAPLYANAIIERYI
jgi:PPIC-type PPIASE domain/SurA N-terminal domain